MSNLNEVIITLLFLTPREELFRYIFIYRTDLQSL